MNKKSFGIYDLIQMNQGANFPEGVCCAEHCRDCAYIEMDNDHYNDGTRRCAYRGEWVRPSSPACPKFRY